MDSKEVKHFLEAVSRPLRYVQANQYKRLGQVKNLSRHIVEISNQATAKSLAEHDRAIFQSLRDLFLDFDGLEEKEKQNRVGQAINLLSGDKRGVHFLTQDHPILSCEKLQQAKTCLEKNVQYVKGVGPRIAETFHKADLRTIGDLLTFLPTRYEDRRMISKIRDLREGVQSTVLASVVCSGVVFYKGLRKRVFEVVVEDGTGELRLKWFHFFYPSLGERLKRGQNIVVCGRPKLYRSALEMHHPDFELYAGKVDSISFGRIVAVYREIGGLYQKSLRKIMHRVVSLYAHHRPCLLPAGICQKYDLLPPWKVLSELHHPKRLLDEDRKLALEQMLSFEELFFYCLSLAVRKKHLREKPGIAFPRPSPRFKKLIEELPFELTASQENVLKSIRSDMASPRPMNRLLQGDVGSGKTVVAMLASVIVIDHNHQVAFLAPTEILAEQHFRTLSKWADKVNVRVELLLGGQPAKRRETLRKDLQEGKIDLLLGTHAMLEEDIAFRCLGLVIVDEQHRFGVRQRAILRSKAIEPDVLVMSATPIPRTLALTFYGDLDVSILNELPRGRKPIDTTLIQETNRNRVYEEVRKRVQEGQQAYIVYPLVEPSKQSEAKDATTMAQVFQREIFSDLRVSLIHGQMPSQAKEAIMGQFEQHKIDILVSTTVIEVGIDVCNASIMVIEHPERFGLSQLHQLRGRVGRGSEQSACFLIVPPAVSTWAKERLTTFARIHDGFLLAEEDLKIRGPGDFFGVAQSGFPNFTLAVFPRDLRLLEISRQEAFDVVARDPEFEAPEHQHLSWVLREMWQDRFHLVRIG